MLAVILLRWIFGYFEFCAEGKFPERFVNIASKNGINLWKLRSREDGFHAFARLSEYDSVLYAAKQSGCRIHIIRKHGLPHLVRKYKSRSGLLFGLLLAVLFCKISSSYIWRITVSTPDIINEYEVRAALRENGLYEGVRSDTVDVPLVIDRISTQDRRISWMTVNLVGSTAQIALSPNYSETVTKKEKHTACNIISSADGVVTKVHVHNGTAMVKSGEGIRKGQLLVSGVMEYNNGTQVLADSQAQILAKTSRRITIAIPAKAEVLKKTDNVIENKSLSVFGIELPLTLNGRCPGEYASYTYRNQMSLFDNTLPVYYTVQQLREYKKMPEELSLSQAEKILGKRIQLYEVFMINSARNAKVLKKDYSVKKNGSTYTLTAEYEIEEDVCKTSVIDIQKE